MCASLGWDLREGTDLEYLGSGSRRAKDLRWERVGVVGTQGQKKSGVAGGNAGRGKCGEMTFRR